MDPSLDREIAASLDVPSDLLPHLPALYAGLDALGSSPETHVALLRPHAGELKAGQVLDLGSGLGTVGIALATELELRVLGVDAFEPFVDIARARAAAAGVANLCAFRADDLRRMLEAEGRFEAVVWVAMGGLLGGLADTIARLRRLVRVGGYLLIERELAGGGDPAALRAELTAHGDEVVREVEVPAWQLREAREDALARVRARGEALAAEDPAMLLELLHWLDHAAGRDANGARDVVGLLRRRG
ncbi:MAG TPA: class I SAM-dependent methyltransferase [Candidatus Eisenbacteria bacterium]|nr:class I SAM-dependent methyltransferase [Candidatus Eisenbacteria bacterium]